MQARTGRQKQETAQAEFQMTFPGVGTESLQLLLAASRPGHQFIKQHCMGRSLLNAREFQRKKNLTQIELLENCGPCLIHLGNAPEKGRLTFADSVGSFHDQTVLARIKALHRSPILQACNLITDGSQKWENIVSVRFLSN